MLVIVIVIDERDWAQKSEDKNAERRTPNTEHRTSNAERLVLYASVAVWLTVR